MRRRRLLALAGTLTSGSLLAGCSASADRPADGGGSAETGRGGTVTPMAPNDDGHASEGELYWMLEDQGIAVDRLTLSGDAVRLAYTSEAETQSNYVDEMARIASRYAIYVEHGGEGTRMDVVANGYGSGAGGFTIQREWIEQYNDESMSGQELLNRILQTAQ